MDSCPKLVGDSMWVTCNRNGGQISDYIFEGSVSRTGIARVVLLFKLTVLVKISGIARFERFFEYFEGDF